MRESRLKLTAGVVAISAVMAGCTTQRAIQNWMPDGTGTNIGLFSHHRMPVELTEAKNNPVYIVRMSAAGSDQLTHAAAPAYNLGGQAGGGVAQALGSTLPGMIIGTMVGAVGSAIAGLTYDKSVQHMAKGAGDGVYQVYYASAYGFVNAFMWAGQNGKSVTPGSRTNPKIWMPSILVTFKSMPTPDVLRTSYFVMNESGKKIGGQPIYTATAVADATPDQVNSPKFLQYLQANPGHPESMYTD